MESSIRGLRETELLEAILRPIIEESPYKPEAFNSRLILPMAHLNAHKVLQSLAKPYRFLSAQIQTAS